MNFVENNGKKVAAILCVASALPVVGTIYAMESQPGWHGDKYVKKDRTIAKNSWVTSNKKAIYLDKDGKADTEKAYNASATALSNDTIATVADSVKASTVEAVDTESSRLDDTTQATESVAKTDVADTTVVAAVVDETNKADSTNLLEKAASTSDVVSTPVVNEDTQSTITTPVSDQTTTIVEQPTTPVDTTQTTAPVDNTQTTTPVQPAAPADNTQTTTPTTPADNTQTTTPVQPADNTQMTTPTTPADNTQTTQNSSFNERVAQAALAEIGEHEWCTNTATDALNAAAGSEVYGVYWPDQYQSLGTVFTDRSLLQPGNLVYYANDGRAGSEGVVVPDHIAVYVGNDTVVNGGWGYTANVAASNIDVPAGTQYYIAINQ